MQNLQKLDDQALVLSYIQGNELAISELILRHKNRVFSYVYNIVRDKQLAEDVFQDTFVKVINTIKRGAYNEEGKFLPWVLRIAHNLTVDTFRKNKRMPIVDGGEDFDLFDVIKRDDPTVEEEMITEQICCDVRKLIDKLPEDQREVLIMRHYRELSFKEIAEETNVSINTALGRMRYALINIRKLIKEHNVMLDRA